jgi:hypothetical protein
VFGFTTPVPYPFGEKRTVAGTRRLRSNCLALPIRLRVPMQRVVQRKATAGTYRWWVSLGYGSWGAIVLRSEHGEVSEANMHASPLPVITDEITIVDSQGHPRIIMSARSGNPVIQLLETNGAIGMEVLLDSTGRPAVKLANPDSKGPTAVLEVDDKGTQVLFDRPGGASSYLFLNNAGASGVVLVDSNGVRRLEVLVESDCNVKMEQFGADGKPIPQLKS